MVGFVLMPSINNNFISLGEGYIYWRLRNKSYEDWILEELPMLLGQLLTKSHIISSLLKTRCYFNPLNQL